MEELTTVKKESVRFSRGDETAFPGYAKPVEYMGETRPARWISRQETGWLMKKEDVSAFYGNLCQHLKENPPADSLLWPVDVTSKTDAGFGYVMETYPQAFRPIRDFLDGNEGFTGWPMIVNAALSLTVAFLQLKAGGYHYHNLTNDDVLVHNKTGRVRLAGAEYLSRTGKIKLTECSTLMAPKYLLGEREADSRTDEYLLAVLLFELFFQGHPLEGHKTAENPVMTAAKKREYYGKAPVFIYDKADGSNPPVKGIHIGPLGMWAQYPAFLQEQFRKAFSKEALSGEKAGETVEEWYSTLIALRASIAPCSCGRAHFLPSLTGGRGVCPCGNKIEEPAFYWKLEGGKQWYPIIPGGVIYQCQLKEKAEMDVSSQAGMMLRGRGADFCQIQNVMDEPWTVTGDGEETETVGNLETVLVKGPMSIDTGVGKIVVEAAANLENEV